jgi:hypothetical protein
VLIDSDIAQDWYRYKVTGYKSKTLEGRIKEAFENAQNNYPQSNASPTYGTSEPLFSLNGG